MDNLEDNPEDLNKLSEETNEIPVNEENLQESPEETDNALPADEEQREKLVQLPLGRVKKLIKMDPEVCIVNPEAVFLIAKSVELFIDSLAKEAYKYTVLNRKRTVQKYDVETAIDNVDALVFLEGTLN